MKCSRTGFTLVEIIAVLVILGVLIAVAIPLASGYIDRADGAACAQNRSEIEKDAKFTFTAEASERTPDLEQIYNETLAAKLTEGNYACPSGGTYTVEADGDGFCIRCSKHGTISGS